MALTAAAAASWAVWQVEKLEKKPTSKTKTHTSAGEGAGAVEPWSKANNWLPSALMRTLTTLCNVANMPWAWWRLFAYYQKTSRESYHSSTLSRSALHVFSQWTNPFSDPVFTSCSCQMLAVWNGSHKHTDFTLLPLELSLGLSIRDVFLMVPSRFFFLFHFSNLLNRRLTSSCWFLPVQG